MASPILTLEYKGALLPKKKAELQEIAIAMEINPIPVSKLDIIDAIKSALSHNQDTWKSDPRFAKLYEKGHRGRPSVAVRDSTPGSSSGSPNPNSRDDDDEHVPSSLSPEEYNNSYLQPSSSSSYNNNNNNNGGGIPKGRELPRSPIKQVTDSLPALAIPGSVKKLANSIFARPAAVAEDVVDKVKAAEEHVGEQLASGRRGSLRVAKKAKEVVEEVEEEVENGVVVAVDQAEALIKKAQGFWDKKVWTPSGRILSSPTSQTLLLLLLELLPLLLTTLIFKTYTLTFPPPYPTNPASAKAPIAGEYNLAPPPHVITNHNVNHPWINVDLRVVDWQTSFKGWDANQRLVHPVVAWTALTVLAPAVLSLLVGSKNNAGGKTLVFHILRLGVWGALATQVAGGEGGFVVNSLRGTGLAGGLGVVASGVGVLLGLANALGAKQ